MKSSVIRNTIISQDTSTVFLQAHYLNIVGLDFTVTLKQALGFYFWERPPTSIRTKNNRERNIVRTKKTTKLILSITDAMSSYEYSVSLFVIMLLVSLLGFSCLLAER